MSDELFNYWKECLEESTAALTTLLAAATPLDHGAIAQALDTMIIDYENVLPFASSKKQSIDYTLVLPTVRKTLQLKAQVARLQGNQGTKVVVPAQMEPSARRKLPELIVPVFSGKFADYPSFRKVFRLKHDDSVASGAEKLVHLQNNVSGEPKLLIKNLAAEDGNYELAFATLDSKYDKKDKVLSELYAALDQLPPATDSTDSLNNVYYQLEGQLTALKAHGEQVDTNTLLRDKVYSKYPVNVVCRVTNEELMMPTNFQSAIAKYLSLRASIEGVRRLPAPEETKPKALTSALAASVSQKVDRSPPRTPTNRRNRERKKETPSCAFCSEKHYSGECPSVITFSARKAALKDRCVLCLSSEHKKPACPRTYTCGLCKKKNEHARAICPMAYEDDKPKKLSPSTSADSESPTVPTKPNRTLNFAARTGGAHTTFMCSIVNPVTNRSYAVRGLLDNGCNNTYVSEEFARRAGLTIHSTTMMPISVFLHNNPIQTKCGQTIAILSNGAEYQQSIQIDTLPYIPQDCVLFDYDEFCRQNPQYAHLTFVPQADDQPIELVIGSDVFWSLLLPESKVSLGNDCFLFNTLFGWALVGRVSHYAQHSILFASNPKQALDRLYSLDALGVHDTPKSIVQEEECALQSFYRELKFVNNRYQISWPWRTHPPDLPNNFALALGRLRSLYNTLTSDSFHEYDRIIQDQIEKGIVERVPENEVRERNSYYLPHKAVFTPEKSTKLRIVYDGSARQSKTSKSLNDAIYKGSNLLNNLVALVIKFRLRPIAILADVEKAFLQISLAEPDRNYVRFLWTAGFQPPLSNSQLVVLRFTRVAFGVNAAPFLMNAVFEHHIRHNPTDFTEQLSQDKYADNFCTGTQDAATGYRLYTQAKALFARCSMNLRCWATNSAELREKFADDDQEKNSVLSVLGTEWDSVKDTLKIKEFSPAENFTLRGVLSSVSTFYDVLGLFTPLHVRAKLFIQDVHRAHKTWNEQIHADFEPRWYEIETDYLAAEKMTFPRLLANIDGDQECQFHVFADASTRAIAAVAYLRVHDRKLGTTQVHLIFSKSKIVKPDTYTVPKLELMAIVLATKVLKFLRSVITRECETYNWSDSKCALMWVKNTVKILPVFVSNRVKQIRECPRVSFRYIAGPDNPADIPSRGAALDDLHPDSIWWSGPSWLATDHWPEDYVNFDDTVYALETERAILAASVTPEARKSIQPFSLDPGKFSELMPLLRQTAYWIRFLQYRFPNHTFDFQKYANRAVTQAEMLWVKAEQSFHFHDVFIALQTGRRHDIIHRLGLFLDEHGIIRCAHRLKHSALRHREKFPILLQRAKSSYFTKLVIRHFHALVYHQGTSYTLAAIRKEFWIPAGRAAVSSVVTACHRCKRFTSRPFRQPDDSQLPSFRLDANSSPFQNIGIDTCGPLAVNDAKSWVVIFVDLVCRAIDLEYLTDMTTDELLHAFRRVSARRRMPAFIISDNAEQFKLLHVVLSASLDMDFRWKFIPSFSQWQGGVYERQIQILKQSLCRTFHGTALTPTAVRTALAEIAAMLNDRPLTYVSEDGDDRPLTPNDFLQARFTLPEEIKIPENATPTAAQVVALWKKSQEKTQEFWDAWSTRYLQSLRSERRPYLFPRATSQTTPCEGMVVLVSEKLHKRSSWKIGRILQLNVSDDGEIRSATLKIGNRKLPTSSGKWDFKCQVITRPLCALYPLELPEIAPEPETGPPATASQPPPSPDLENENTDAEHVEEIEIEVDVPYDF